MKGKNASELVETKFPVTTKLSPLNGLTVKYVISYVLLTTIIQLVRHGCQTSKNKVFIWILLILWMSRKKNEYNILGFPSTNIQQDVWFEGLLQSLTSDCKVQMKPKLCCMWCTIPFGAPSSNSAVLSHRAVVCLTCWPSFSANWWDSNCRVR